MTVKPSHLVIFMLILVGAFYGLELRQNNSLQSYSNEQTAHAEEIILDGCKRGNLRSAYELANDSDGPARHLLAAEILPIVNCEKTQVLHHYTTINKSVQDRYVRIVVRRHRWPQISLQGQIVGTEPLPAATQKP